MEGIVCRVREVVGVSAETAAKHVAHLRIAEVMRADLAIENGRR